MTIETDYEIGQLVAHRDDGMGVVERIEVDVEGALDPVIIYHIKFENGETVMHFEYDIEDVGTR